MADDQTLNVTITADAADLTAAMQAAASTVQATLAAVGQSAQTVNIQITEIGNTAQKAAKEGKSATDIWTKSFSNLQSTFTNSINGMILGTTTWQKAVQRISQTVLSDLLNATEKTVASWLTGETTKTAATEAGTTARNAAESAGQSQGLAEMVLNGLKAITASAAQAAANTYSSVSAIPYVGWILAPPAAAAAFAAVLAFGSKMPSAAGGMWNVPSDTLALIHKQETILPASIAQPMRDFFTGGGAGGQGGGDSYAITIQALDTQSGAQFLMNNAGVIAQGLARELRNGNASLRGATR